MAHPYATVVTSIVARAALLAGLWWILVQGQADAWLVGLPAVALAAMASVYLDREALPGISLAGLFGFVMLFLLESIRGGFDVALRTLTPKLRIKPGFRRYQLHTSNPAARVLLVNCIGLLPGTLAADLEGDVVGLHLLDSDVNPEPQLLRLEQAVARLYGLTLEMNHV